MRYAILSRGVGSLLLAAAALKAYGLGADPVGRMGVFSMPEVQLAIIEFEIFLGVWLWYGVGAIASWAIALATFAIFTCVTLYLGLVGQSSCGCFGRLSPSPWFAFGVDVVIAIALVLFRPDLAALRTNPRQTVKAAGWPIVCSLGGIALISIVLVGAAQLCFGSVPAAIAHFRGERVSLPRLVQVEDGFPGEQRTVSVEVANWTDEPIRLIGGTADCTCTVLGDLPVAIPAKESRSVSVEINLSKRPGIYTRNAGFLVDDQGLKQIGFAMTGRILKTDKDSEVVGKAP